MEAKDLLLTAIEAVIALKEKFKTDYVINILRGKETSEIETYGHQDLDVFGSGDDTDDETWNAVIRQALIAGYFDKDIENYGLLRVTKKGKDFLKKPASFKITTADEEDLSDDENIDDVVVKGGGGGSASPLSPSISSASSNPTSPCPNRANCTFA